MKDNLTGKTDNTTDWFYPDWAAKAPYNKPVVVKDTDSALGRYNMKTREIGLKDIARIHGHMCDGLVIAFVEIKAVFEKLFPDGVVDRTDLCAVSKNGPCWADAAAFLTGARINFRTIRIDVSIGDGFIIQRMSTGETYDVHLKPGVFPDDQTVLVCRVPLADVWPLAHFEGNVRKGEDVVTGSGATVASDGTTSNRRRGASGGVCLMSSRGVDSEQRPASGRHLDGQRLAVVVLVRLIDAAAEINPDFGPVGSGGIISIVPFDPLVFVGVQRRF